eukprot:4088622-Amphidinium_carterae.1
MGVQCRGGLAVATWNISAVNNNPFEYWITHEDSCMYSTLGDLPKCSGSSIQLLQDERYSKLMADVEAFVEAPGDRDATVAEVLPQDVLLAL